jgi:hypothetical protein
VAHCGWTGAGPFLYTLTLVDVATGWVSCAGLRDKRAETVLAALRRLQEGLPFKLRGLDSDCGSEFLNSALISYCANQHITFTRGRPYRKNDGCHVEQRTGLWCDAWWGINAWTRQPCLRWSVCTTSLATGVNFLHPVRRMTEKVRLGAASRAATTPPRHRIDGYWPGHVCRRRLPGSLHVDPRSSTRCT